MKRMMILVCCLLLAFAAFAVENSAVIGPRTATKGAAALTQPATTQFGDVPMTVEGLKTRIEKMQALGQDATPLERQLVARFGNHQENGSHLDAVGDNCATPIVLNVPADLTYTDAGRSTQFAVNDYSATCLGNYDNGPDVLYQLNVTAATTVTITCTPVGTSQYAGMVIGTTCPAPGSGCLATASAVSGAISISSLALGVGTYYLMVDNWAPGPDYITYTLTIQAIAATGRCCYPNPTACTPGCTDNVTAAYCSSLGGNFTPGASCVGFTCPTPQPGELCCNAFPLTVPGTATGDNTSFVDNYNAVCPYTSTGGHDVIYSYSPAVNQQVTFDLCGSAYDTKLYIYDNVCSGTPIACNDDYGVSSCGGDGYKSRLDCVPLQAGHTYFVVVDAYSAGDQGNYVLVTTVCGSTFDCSTLTSCGTPVEVEPNDVCPPPTDQAVIGCPGLSCPNVVPVVYGTQCPTTDVDFWAVCVPGFTKLTLTPFEGPNCDATPVTSFLGQFYLNDCTTALGAAFSGAFAISNSGPAPVVIFLKIYHATGGNPVQYKLTAACCALYNPCDHIIPIGAVTHFTATVNTCVDDPCGAASVPPCVFETVCGTAPCFTSGPSKIFSFTLSQAATNINITATAAGTGDEQVMVFTDCSDPLGSCVGTQDLNAGGTGGETIPTLSLPAGTYFVSVSYYGAGTCGDITLDITSDVQLPVTMGDVSIVPMDNAVELRWTTQSETHLDKWIVKRDNVAVYQVNATNGASLHNYSFTDMSAVNGRTYSYDLVARNSDGSESVVRTLSATPTVGAGVVDAYALHQNYPNPFNPTTDIVYDLKDAGMVSLKVYNLMGQEVATLVNGNMTAGRHTISFNATNLPSGLYLCKMTAGSYTSQIKMLLMK